MSEKFNLIGVYNDVYQEKIGERFLDHYSEKIVATFSSAKLAKAYIKNSKLKQPKRETYGPDKVFKDKSLLSGAIGASVEKDYGQVELPHDPEI